MIDIWQYAKKLEQGLNDGLENLAFKIWVDVGKFDLGYRDKNEAVNIIPCLLRRVSAPVTTPNNGIFVATENLVMDVAVPYFPPKKKAGDEQLGEITEEYESEKYVYVEATREYLDNYFHTNTFEAYTIDGDTYQCGFEYHLSEVGDSSLQVGIGQFVTFSVDIIIHIVQNGLNSMDVKVFIDGIQAPFLTASPSRSTIKQSDVYAGLGSESKTANTSTAFALDITAPATDSRITSQFIDFLLYGKKDVAHFVKIKMGNKTRLMYATFGDVSASIEGVLNVGTTITLAPITDNPELIEYPDYFSVYRISLPDPVQDVTLTVTTAGEFCLHFEKDFYKEGNKIYNDSGKESVIKVTTQMLLYDPDHDEYYTYIAIVSEKAFTLASDTGTLTELTIANN